MRHEASLQAAWRTKSRGAVFYTTDGRRATILNQGLINTTNGPDFTGAAVRLDDTVYYGSIELHLETSGWYTHGHHADPRFNDVILHVVSAPKGLTCVTRADGRLCPTIQFDCFETVNEKPLPCRPFWGEALAPSLTREIAVAKVRYLELMLARLAAWVPPGSPPSAFLIHTILGGAAEILGGSLNRDLLCNSARRLLGIPEIPARFQTANVRSVRPKARPEIRLRQLEAMFHALNTLHPKDVTGLEPEHSWETLCLRLPEKPGAETLQTLFQLVWIPALLLLAELIRSESWKRTCFDSWTRNEHPVPPFMRRRFSGAGVPVHRNTGLVFLMKRHCGAGACNGCGVFREIVRQS